MPKKKTIKPADEALLLQLSENAWDTAWGLQHLESYFNADHAARIQAETILVAVTKFRSTLPSWIEEAKRWNPPSS
jgi:hypothetical protein